VAIAVGLAFVPTGAGTLTQTPGNVLLAGAIDVATSAAVAVAAFLCTRRPNPASAARGHALRYVSRGGAALMLLSTLVQNAGPAYVVTVGQESFGLTGLAVSLLGNQTGAGLMLGGTFGWLATLGPRVPSRRLTVWPALAAAAWLVSMGVAAGFSLLLLATNFSTAAGSGLARAMDLLQIATAAAAVAAVLTTVVSLVVWHLALTRELRRRADAQGLRAMPPRTV
jgi:hypothetical protein